MAGLKLDPNPREYLGANSGNTSEQFEDKSIPQRLPAGEDVNKRLVRIANLEQQKRDIGAQIRAISREHVENGGTKFALSVIRRIQKMDPDDRSAAWAEIESYGCWLKYW